jgi:hypothetical protein
MNDPITKDFRSMLDAVVNTAVDCGSWDYAGSTPYETFLARSRDAQEALRQYVDGLTAERDQYKGQAEINAQTVMRQAQEIRRLIGPRRGEPA